MEIFERAGADWLPSARLEGSLLGIPDATFGGSLDLQGETVLGSVLKDGNYVTVVFNRDATGAWSAEIVDPSILSSGSPQMALGPGGILAVVRQSPFSPTGGALRVYRRDATGAWEGHFVQPPFSGEFDRISDLQFVGDELVVADIDESSSDYGTAWVYSPVSSGGYTFSQQLDAGTGAFSADELGGFVGTDGEGIVLPIEGSTERIAVIFEASSEGTWSLTETVAVPEGSFLNDAATPVVAADLIVIGSPDSTQSSLNVGRAHVFERDEKGTWHNRTDLVPEIPDELFRFGASMALDGQDLLVGATNVGLASGQLLLSGQVLRFQLDALMRNGATAGLSTGGSQELLLRPEFGAAGDAFVLLGSLSGEDPATPIPGTDLLLPLVLDGYTTLLLNTLGTSASPIQPSIGVLGPLAAATAVLNVPTGLSTSLLGVEAFHAFVTLDAGSQLASASNPVSLSLLP